MDTSSAGAACPNQVSKKTVDRKTGRDCASAMVGHAVHKGRYHYYRCGNAGGRQAQPRHPISSLATRRVESLVRDALTDLLANPERIMAEARRASSESSTQKRKDSVTSALADLELQQRRLIELYTEGQLPKHLLEAKRSALADRRRDLEKQLSELGQTEPNLDITALETSMPTAVQTVMRWIEAADGDDFDLLLEAVDVEVHASADAMEILGSVPVIERPDQRDFNPIEQTSA